MSNNTPHHPNNGTILTIAQIIKAVTSSAAEERIGALYINSCASTPTCHTLKEMGHPQPPTSIQTDNSALLGVVTNTMQHKQTKTMYMRFHWLRCRTLQRQSCTYCHTRPTNKGGYVPKYHAAAHHHIVHSDFLTPKCQLDLLQKAIERCVSQTVPRQ